MWAMSGVAMQQTFGLSEPLVLRRFTAASESGGPSLPELKVHAVEMAILCGLVKASATLCMFTASSVASFESTSSTLSHLTSFLLRSHLSSARKSGTKLDVQITSWPKGNQDLVTDKI
eukprot:4868582-Amphidinium_carterae.1